MGVLNIEPNISGPDDFYAELIAAHEGLPDEESIALNARLVLLLANHVGDRDVLSEAIARARNPRAETGSGPVRSA